jgi:hypothetical protein
VGAANEDGQEFDDRRGHRDPYRYTALVRSEFRTLLEHVMTKLELLANDLAFLTDADMMILAGHLVKDYPTRADVLETCISNNFQDRDLLVDRFAS